MQQNNPQQDFEDVIASDLLGGDVIHADPASGEGPRPDAVEITDGGITDVSGTVPLGGSSDVGGTGDSDANADVGATTGAGSCRVFRPTTRQHRTASTPCCPPEDARVRRWTAVALRPVSRPAGSAWNGQG